MKDRYERKHRRTWKHPEAIAMMTKESRAYWAFIEKVARQVKAMAEMEKDAGIMTEDPTDAGRPADAEGLTERLRALITTWDARLKDICGRLDRCDSAKANEVLKCRNELQTELNRRPAPPEGPARSVPRDLLVRADSLLSLLWHRPSTPHDVDLSLDVERTIGELRNAYK